MQKKPCRIRKSDGGDSPGYYNNEDYRWFSRPVRKNTPGLARMMNVNALLLFISATIAYYAIPEFLLAVGIFPLFQEIRIAYQLFYVSGASFVFMLIFFYHKYHTELKKCAIGNKNREGCEK